MARNRSFQTIYGIMVLMKTKHKVIVDAAAAPADIRTLTILPYTLCYDVKCLHVKSCLDHLSRGPTAIFEPSSKTTMKSTKLSTVEEIEAQLPTNDHQLVSYLVFDSGVEIEVEAACGSRDLTISVTDLAIALDIREEDVGTKCANMLPISVSAQVKGK